MAAPPRGLSPRKTWRAIPLLQRWGSRSGYIKDDKWKSFASIDQASAPHDMSATRAANICAARPMPTRPRASLIGSAGPSPTCSITSVRAMPTCLPIRSAFVDRNVCPRTGGATDTQAAISYPHSNWQRCAAQLWGANCAGLLAAASGSNTTSPRLGHKGGVAQRATDATPSSNRDGVAISTKLVIKLTAP